MFIRTELIDELLKDYKKPDDLFGKEGILKQLTKALVEKCLEMELEVHLEEERAEERETPKSKASQRNRRNGYSQKTVKGEFGETKIQVPRDRKSEFEPILVPKGETRIAGIDEKIISLYARGMTTRDIEEQLKDLYGIEVSHALISKVTDAVESQRKEWQNRTLDRIYPIVYLDAMVVKIRQEGRVINKAIHLALGVNMEGQKELLGMWITENESAKFWLSVMTELQNRGVKDIFIACVDGLTGFPEAIEAVFPKTRVQLCIVHMVRNSLSYVSYKDRKALAADLKAIYGATTLEAAEQALVDFGERWDQSYPVISKSWLTHWERVTPFFAFPEDIRKAIYTTNAIESMNMTLRKVSRHRRSFPSDESALKLIFLALGNLSKKWTMPIRNWKAALNHFAIEFEGRFPL